MHRAMQLDKQGVFVSVLMLLVAMCLLSPSVHAGSIFDDDWKPPQRSESPRKESVSVPEPVQNSPNANVPSVRNTAKTVVSKVIPRSIPEKTDQALKRKLLREVFAKELADSSSTARKALASRLLEEASKASIQSTDQYVLLIGAYEAAKEGQEITLCSKAADSLSEAFEVDDWSLKLAAVAACSKTKNQTGIKAAASAGMELIDSSLASNRYEDTAKAVATLTQVAGRIQDGNLAAIVRDQIRYTKSVCTEYLQVQKDFTILHASPEDQKANLGVGKFYCFVRGDWEKGIPFLAHCADQSIRAAALSELSAPTDAMRIKLADDWWNLAPQQSESARRVIQWHAGSLYRDVIDSLTGLEKLRVQKRLGELSPFGLTPASEFNWAHGNDPVQMIAASQGVCALLQIGGGFQGTSEGVGIAIDNAAVWRLSGVAVARPHAKALSLTAVTPNLLQAPREFVWKTGDQPVRMIRTDEGFCILAGLVGGMRGESEEIRVFPNDDGYWYLQCKSAVTLTVRAMALRVSKPGLLRPSYTEYEWTAGDKSVRMIRKEEGFCFLSGIAGKFEGDSEQVKVYVDNDGFWRLEGDSRQKNLKARAVCVRIDPHGRY